MTLPTGKHGCLHQCGIPVADAFQPREEHDLAVSLRDRNDLAAARALVMSHLRFVVKIALATVATACRKVTLSRRGTVWPDEGGTPFDPKWACASYLLPCTGSRPRSTNTSCATGASSRSRRPRHSASCSSTSQRRKTPGLVSRQGRRGRRGPRGQTRDRARDGVAPVELTTLAYDGTDSDDDDGPSIAPAAYLPDLRHEPRCCSSVQTASMPSAQGLYAALESLDTRSRDVLQRRWLNENKETLHDLAAEYGVSAERIRQIEGRSDEKAAWQHGGLTAHHRAPAHPGPPLMGLFVCAVCGRMPN